MALRNLATHTSSVRSLITACPLVRVQVASQYGPHLLRSSIYPRRHSSQDVEKGSGQDIHSRQPSQQPQQNAQQRPSDRAPSGSAQNSTSNDLGSALTPDWEDDPNYASVTRFSDLPHRLFGHNQHIKVNEEFKEALRGILWQFRAPIRYAFAYGSGVFGQAGSKKKNLGSLSPHPDPPKAVGEWQKGGAKMIDFIFGVSHTQHWHSLNLTQHPDHYSGLKYLPYNSAAISTLQDRFGAGVYFNPYITVNGVMIKYGVVNLDSLNADLTDWQSLYLAGRLQKPVKILRDDARIRLANQINLLSALRTALLMLPEKFTERQLYERIAGLSYLGDPRMWHVPGIGASENLSKVSNIVGAQLPGFRQLYVPLIENLPNVDFSDSRTPRHPGWEKDDAIRHTGSNAQLDEQVVGGADGLTLTQDLDPVKRGNMVRRLPRTFRSKIYYSYKSKFGIPGSAFDSSLQSSSFDENLKRGAAGDFEQRIAADEQLATVVAESIRKTVSWPATTQTVKNFFSAGLSRSWQYWREKRKKNVQGKLPSDLSSPDEKIGKND